VETALNDVCFGDDETHPLDATIDHDTHLARAR